MKTASEKREADRAFLRECLASGLPAASAAITRAVLDEYQDDDPREVARKEILERLGPTTITPERLEALLDYWCE